MLLRMDSWRRKDRDLSSRFSMPRRRRARPVELVTVSESQKRRADAVGLGTAAAELKFIAPAHVQTHRENITHEPSHIHDVVLSLPFVVSVSRSLPPPSAPSPFCSVSRRADSAGFRERESPVAVPVARGRGTGTELFLSWNGRERTSAKTAFSRPRPKIVRDATMESSACFFAEGEVR